MNTPRSTRHRLQPGTTGRARSLRQQSPAPERILWGLLRDRRLGGLKFRRQYPVGPYVADFYCAGASLVVELDGMSHVGRHEQDAVRTAYLVSQGLGVLRVTNDDLLQHPEAVALAILQAARLRASLLPDMSELAASPSMQGNRAPDPHPGPLPERERGKEVEG